MSLSLFNELENASKLLREGDTSHELGNIIAKSIDDASYRIKALEEALRKVLAWGPVIDMTAPELGGCIRAMRDAEKALLYDV